MLPAINLLPRALRHYLPHESLAWLLLPPSVALSRDKATVFVQLGHLSEIQTLTFSRDGEYLASRGNDRAIKLWEAASGREI